MSFENFPYSNFHELNLDWIIQKLKEAYSAENPPDFPVKSVNGMTGDVIIAIPSNFVQSVNGETGDVVLYRNPLTQFPATDETRWNLFRICDGTETGIEFDENGASRIEGIRRIKIYDEDNPPDYPVTSVNGQTGDVQITAGVQSVNGKTGNVLTPFVNPNTDILAIDTDSPSVLWGFSRNVAGGNVALYITTGGTNPQAFIRFTPTDGEAINLPLLTNADIPSSAGVVSVNGKNGVVTLYGNDILLSDSSAENVTETLLNNVNKTNDIWNSILVDKSGNYLTWKNGYYAPSGGVYNQNNIQYKVTEILTPEQHTKITRVRTENDLKVAILAWSNNNFIGIYDKSLNAFNRTFDSEPYFYTDIDVSKINKTFPEYSIAFEIRAFPFRDLQEADRMSVTFTIFNVVTDISTIIDNLSTHSQQISALQTSDSNQSQQISALQTSDSNQSQQISALQTSDSNQSQQISALQTAVDNIQTGAGIKEVKLSEVVTLPTRYPETGTDADIKANMACVNAILSRPGVQRTNFTVEFFDGYLTISGTMQGLTDIILYLTEV